MKIMENQQHRTVLLREAVNKLNILPNGIYIDGTFGRGGHSKLILCQLREHGRLLAIDRDPKAIDFAKNINDPRFSIEYGLFSSLSKYVSKRGLTKKINGILLDLGVSSPQFDDGKRGFSFMRDGPLDMRMDQTFGQSATELLQKAKERDIAFALKTLGEERFAKKIANAIVNRNKNRPITRTKELVEVILKTIPVKYKFKHPATRTFQAIRIWVNNELEELKLVLKSSIEVLAPRGRLSIISFNSLEDRIIKQFFREQSFNIKIPTRLPITEEQVKNLNNPNLQYLGKLIPCKEEIKKNPRARSAILRFAERINI